LPASNMQPKRQQPGCARSTAAKRTKHSVSKDHIKQTRAHRSKIGLIVTLVSLLVLFFSVTVGLCSLCCLCCLFVSVVCVRLRVELANLLSAVSVLPLCCLFVSVVCVSDCTSWACTFDPFRHTIKWLSWASRFSKDYVRSRRGYGVAST
jgi:hypothetical protein